MKSNKLSLNVLTTILACAMTNVSPVSEGFKSASAGCKMEFVKPDKAKKELSDTELLLRFADFLKNEATEEDINSIHIHGSEFSKEDLKALKEFGRDIIIKDRS